MSYNLGEQRVHKVKLRTSWCRTGRRKQPRRNWNFPRRAKKKKKKKKIQDEEDSRWHHEKHFNVYYLDFRRKGRIIKCKPFLVAKRRIMVPGVPSVDRWNWENATSFYIVCSLFLSDVLYGMRSFVKKFVARFTPYTFISLTKTSIVFGTGRSTNYIAWKPAKWAKFMLNSFSRGNKVRLRKQWQKSYDCWLKNKLWCWNRYLQPTGCWKAGQRYPPDNSLSSG